MRIAAITLLFFLKVIVARPAENQWIFPDPSGSRDLAMGTSTVALPYAPQSQSMNPAGLTLWKPAGPIRMTAILNAAAPWQMAYYDAGGRSDIEQLTDAVRMLVCGVGGQYRALTVMIFLSQPMMMADVEPATTKEPFRWNVHDLHTNSLHANLTLHPRVSVGGRVDRYYRLDDPEGESYSYGVIFKPRGIRLGVQYQRFPASGIRRRYSLDRRGDAATTAGLSTMIGTVTVTGQVMNLTNSETTAFLEPHAGVEWRPSRLIAFRGGGMQFSRSRRWAVTTGFSFGDANWIRPRSARLLVPDDILQCAFAWQFEDRAQETFIGSLTFAVRI